MALSISVVEIGISTSMAGAEQPATAPLAMPARCGPGVDRGLICVGATKSQISALARQNSAWR